MGGIGNAGFLVVLNKLESVRIQQSILIGGLALSMAWGNAVKAQERCGTMQLNPETAKSAAWQAHEAQSRRDYAQYLSAGASKVTGVERVIPCVVHLIQQSPMHAISDARVQSQIDVLNEDFLKLNADTASIPAEFQGVATNCNIRFCLAKIDPNGCPTTGINRVIAPALAVHGIDDEQALKSYVQWDPHKYLNIWVPVSLKDNLLGYATFPTWLPFAPQNDGVVINGRNLGRGNGTPQSAYNLGRTGTHEVGHWLGLYHTFQDGCSGMTAQNCLTQGDEVCDTPPTSNPMFGCPVNLNNSCQESPVDRNDQTMNYMDYTDDRCMYMLSQGQRDRIYFFLDNERAQIWSAANLTATGCDGTVSAGCLPIAAFEATPSNVCVGNSIAFYDQSFGPATTWDWTFAGGNPATSTLQNPIVTWSQPGTYAVTLRVSNGIGADTLTQTSAVTVVAPTSGPLIEGFEGLVTLPLDWYATDADLEGTWRVSTAAGHTGAQSAWIDNYSSSTPHTQDELVSRMLDLSGASAAELTFAHAYRRRGSFVIDSLQVLASTDCGVTWDLLWEKAGVPLTTVGGYATLAPFVPTAAQWKNDTVDLQSYLGAPSLRLKFRSIGGASQAIYIDDINILGLVGTQSGIFQELGVRVFPNPAIGAPSIIVQLQQSARVSIELRDLQGRVQQGWPTQLLQAGSNPLGISEEAWGKMPAGLYFLTVTSASAGKVIKVVKAD
jgi:PKD repeat protein